MQIIAQENLGRRMMEIHREPATKHDNDAVQEAEVATDESQIAVVTAKMHAQDST